MAAANLGYEIGQKLRAIGCVHHFRVELHAIKPALFVRNGGIGRAFRCGDGEETFGDFNNPVAVAHPHLMPLALGPHAIKKGAVGLDVEESPAKFAVIGRLNLASQHIAHGLFTITDAENRNAALENSRIGRGGSSLMHAGWAAGKDDAFQVWPIQRLGNRLKRNNFRVNPRFAHAARDELGYLRAKINNEDTVCHGEGLKQPEIMCNWSNFTDFLCWAEKASEIYRVKTRQKTGRGDQTNGN